MLLYIDAWESFDVISVMRQVRASLAAGTVTLDKFVITKQLTKRPEDYPDAKNQPHVQVALRRRAAHKRDGTMQVRAYGLPHPTG